MLTIITTRKCITEQIEIIGQSTELADNNSWASITLRGESMSAPVVITGTPRELRAMCRAGLEGLRKRKDR